MAKHQFSEIVRSINKACKEHPKCVFAEVNNCGNHDTFRISAARGNRGTIEVLVITGNEWMPLSETRKWFIKEV